MHEILGKHVEIIVKRANTHPVLIACEALFRALCICSHR